ncbi:hypothetical protein JXR93_00250 [bacterium]|nr:hypothetical protein [bacterium]
MKSIFLSVLFMFLINLTLFGESNSSKINKKNSKVDSKLLTNKDSNLLKKESDNDSIREFDIKTIEKLGKQIYQQDIYAAKATDILLEKKGGIEALQKEKILGWIVIENKTGAIVKFIKEIKGKYIPVYDIKFTSTKNGILTNAKGKLTKKELAQFKARQTALQSITEFCSPNYNTVVLPNINGKGFLVYALAATTKPNVAVIGGHYRVIVSSDGSKVEKIDKLSKACLVAPTKDNSNNVAGLVLTHLVSKTPIETHVFLNLLHKQTVYVGTIDKKIWKIDEGKIQQIENIE